MSFIIVLGAIIFILCAVSICLLIRQPRQSNRQRNRFKPLPKQKIKPQKTKQQRKRQQSSSVPKREPRLGSSPFEMTQSDATDAVLGLQEVPSSKPVNTSSTHKQFHKDSLAAERRLIVFYLRAEAGKPYAGYELLQTLLSAGLRFGDMSIFHHPAGFSLASSTSPGTFNMDEMGGFSCGGLSMFLSLENCRDPLTAFKAMLDTADQLVQDLGGEVLDEGQLLLTKEKVMALYHELQNAYV